MGGESIKRERQASTVPRIYLSEKDRVCKHRPATAVSECGRRKSALTEYVDCVTCPDCLAALRADSNPSGSGSDS